MIAGNPCFVAVLLKLDDEGNRTVDHYVFFDEAEAREASTVIVDATPTCVSMIVYDALMFTPAVKQ